MEPVNRGSAWRQYPDLFPKARYDIEWCGYDSLEKELAYLNTNPTDIRNVTCGICGPIYNNDPTVPATIFKPNLNGGTYQTVYSYEKSSPIYRGYIVRTYNQSQTINIRLRIEANHKGSVQFRICNADALVADPKMECFENNILKFTDGSTEMALNDGVASNTVVDDDGSIKRGNFVFRVTLPDYLTCNHCLFQWRWFNTGNGQKYFGCSDISIVQPSPYTHV